MSDNYDINRVNLRDLDQTYVIDTDTLMLVQYNGKDKKYKYREFIDRIESDLKSEDRNKNWNAHYIDGQTFDSDGTDDLSVFIYRDSQGAYVPRRMVPDYIDWEDNVSDQRFLRLDDTGKLISDDIRTSFLRPNDSSQAGNFLRVTDDGEFIEEYFFDTEAFVENPTEAIDDVNSINSGVHRVSTSTSNIPENESGYLISLTSDSYDDETQLYFSSESNKLRYRYHDGSSQSDWVTVYNDDENPLSDSITSDSQEHIATSYAVKRVQDNLEDYQELQTEQYFLDQIKEVHGEGSGLDADYLDGLDSTDFATMFRDTELSDIPENAIRFNTSSSKFERKQGGSLNNIEISGEGVEQADANTYGVVRKASESIARNGSDNERYMSSLNVLQAMKRYGLGVDSDPGEEVTDANAVREVGMYRLSSNASENPFSGTSASLAVYRPGSNDSVHQVAYEANSYDMALRYYDGSNWSEWEQFFNTGNAGDIVFKDLGPEGDQIADNNQYQEGIDRSNNLSKIVWHKELDQGTSSGQRVLLLARRDTDVFINIEIVGSRSSSSEAANSTNRINVLYRAGNNGTPNIGTVWGEGREDRTLDPENLVTLTYNGTDYIAMIAASDTTTAGFNNATISGVVHNAELEWINTSEVSNVEDYESPIRYFGRPGDKVGTSELMEGISNFETIQKDGEDLDDRFARVNSENIFAEDQVVNGLTIDNMGSVASRVGLQLRRSGNQYNVHMSTGRLHIHHDDQDQSSAIVLDENSNLGIGLRPSASTDYKVHIDGNTRVDGELEENGDRVATRNYVDNQSQIDAPVGAVMGFYRDTAPEGWLVGDGSTISSSDFPILHSLTGGTLPDFDDEFIRGTTNGSEVGNTELDQMQRITGRAGTQSMAWTSQEFSEGVFSWETVGGDRADNRSGTNNRLIFDSGDSPNARVSDTTSGETRPRNMRLLMCIKHD